MKLMTFGTSQGEELFFLTNGPPHYVARNQDVDFSQVQVRGLSPAETAALHNRILRLKAEMPNLYDPTMAWYKAAPRTSENIIFAKMLIAFKQKVGGLPLQKDYTLQEGSRTARAVSDREAEFTFLQKHVASVIRGGKPPTVKLDDDDYPRETDNASKGVAIGFAALVGIALGAKVLIRKALS